MKKDNMTLEFKNDHAVIFDHSVNLIVTKSGHYGISINAYKTTSGKNMNVTLTENNK